jgi:hypothetical protein
MEGGPRHVRAIRLPDARHDPADRADRQRQIRGRVGIFELLPVDEQLGAKIVAGCGEGEFRIVSLTAWS